MKSDPTRESKSGIRLDIYVRASTRLLGAKTLLGRRVIDMLAERNGGLVNFEIKRGSSRYLPSQRAKDWWIGRVGVDIYGDGTRVKIPTVVVRGP